MTESGRVSRRLNAETWARVETLFHRSAELDPTEVQSFLDRECAGDAALRAEVESLLKSASVGVANRLGAVGRVSERLMKNSEPVSVGHKLAGYRIVREIGRGGSGIVFLGVKEQNTFEHHVAIKVLPGAVLSKSSMERFGNERQIFASLTHRNIARFLDSGATDEGVPYFVMEFVDGVPVDRYCDSHRLDVVGRIAIFLNVCAAVEYAHEQRIIHRDLKPGNILVMASGTPKLLDFGIAKLVRPEQKLTGATTVTRIMTFRYASPEQLRGERIGTPSDIYSLGVILYRLLTGALPFGDSETTPAELEQMIAAREPPPPSTTARDASLRGGVDAIVLKALRREPDLRYPSASAMASDLHNYLTGKPVSVARS